MTGYYVPALAPRYSPSQAGSEPEPARPASEPRPRIALDPDNVRNGLGKLVLTVVELLRGLLERQAMRRIDSGSLSDEEVERLGTTFLRLSEEMARLRQVFGLEEKDLNLDLGPLGQLV